MFNLPGKTQKIWYRPRKLRRNRHLNFQTLESWDSCFGQVDEGIQKNFFWNVIYLNQAKMKWFDFLISTPESTGNDVIKMV